MLSMSMLQSKLIRAANTIFYNFMKVHYRLKLAKDKEVSNLIASSDS